MYFRDLEGLRYIEKGDNERTHGGSSILFSSDSFQLRSAIPEGNLRRYQLQGSYMLLIGHQNILSLSPSSYPLLSLRSSPDSLTLETYLLRLL